MEPLKSLLKLVFIALFAILPASVGAQELSSPYPYVNEGDAPVLFFSVDSPNQESVECYYSIDYVDASLEDVDNALYTQGGEGVTLLGPCTVTAYSKQNDTTSETVTAQYFGFEQTTLTQEYNGEANLLVNAPAIVPSAASGVNVLYALYSGNSLDVDGETGQMTLTGVGSYTVSASIETGDPDSQSFVVLNSSDFPITFNLEVRPAVPTFSPAGGAYDEAQTVTIASGIGDASINYYYGTEIPPAVNTYEEALAISETTTLNAWVVARTADGAPFYSDTVTVVYTIRQDAGLLFRDPTIQANIEELTTATGKLGMGFTSTQPELYNPNQLEISYESSNPAVATVGTDGTVTIVGAGETTITASSVADDNFKAGSASYTLTVEKGDASVSFSTDVSEGFSVVYGSAFTAPVATTTPAGLTIDYTSTDSGVAVVDASGAVTLVGIGNTTIWAAFRGDDNYNKADSVSYQLTVTAAPITLSVSLEGWTYGETAKTPVVEGNTGDGALTIEYKQKDAADETYSTTVPTAVGDYTVRVTVAAAGNYQGGSATADFSISAATATLAGTDQTVTYNGEAQAYANGSTTAGTLVVTYYSSAANRSDGVEGTTDAPVDAGIYYVRLTQGDANYTSAPVDVTFTISAAAITAVTLAETSLTYNGSEQTVAVASVMAGDLTLTADDYTVAGNAATTPGTYTVTVAAVDGSNFSGSATADFTIGAKSIADVAIADIAAQDYTGTAVKPVLSVTDGATPLVLDTDYTVAYTDSIDAGEATATITGKGNYSGTATKKYTISPVGLEGVSIAAIADQDFTGEAVTPTVTVTFNGLPVSADEYTVAYANNTNVGEATVTLTSAGRNFTAATTKTATFQIVPGSLAYNLIIAGVQVTVNNKDNVFGDDNKTVCFNDQTNTLYLTDAVIAGSVVSSIASLTIHVLGENTISNNADVPLKSTVANAPLTFTTTPNSPGSLVLENSSKTFISGFASPTYECDLAEQSVEDNENALKIAQLSAIDPIMDDDGTGNTPHVTIDISSETFSSEDNFLQNTEIDDVLYTLPTVTNENGDTQGFDNSDGVDGVVIVTGMTDEEVAAAADYVPGTDDFLQHFKGITAMLPAGIGELTIDVKSTNGGVLKAKVGHTDPITFDSLGEDYQTVTIPYACEEPTCVYVYLADNAVSASRASGPRHEKVQTGAVKVTGLAGNSKVVITKHPGQGIETTQVKVFSLAGITSYDAYNDDASGITLSTVAVSSAAALSRGAGRLNEPAEDLVTFKITDLGTKVFDEVADKLGISFIDLKDTDIKEFIVSREAGVLSGFDKWTLIILPEGNDDGGEQNVVVGSTCSSLLLGSDKTFIAPRDFTALEAELEREFVAEKATTLVLPFTVPSAQAQALGSFSTFNKKMKEDIALFSEVEGDIPANAPSLFIPNTNGSSLTATDVAVTSLGRNVAPVGPESFFGTYRKLAWEAAQNDVYVLQPDAEENKFVRAEAGTSLSPFEAYLDIDAGVPALRVVIGDETTVGISDATVSFSDQSLYDLQGRRVMEGQTGKGLYIRNGKKLIVK